MFACSSSITFQFAVFDIFEIGVTERVGKKLDFKHVLRILAEDWRSGLQQCIAAGGANFFK